MSMDIIEILFLSGIIIHSIWDVVGDSRVLFEDWEKEDIIPIYEWFVS